MDGDALTRLRRRALGAAAALADLVLPRACLVCTTLLRAEEPGLVCGRCWLAAEELPRPRCARCGHPSATGLTAMRPARGPTSVRHVGGPSSMRQADRPTAVRQIGGPDFAPPAPCRWCELLPPWVRSARSAYALPGGTAESVVHALKYAGWRAVAGEMGRRMATLRFPDDVERERAGLVPVPLSATRLRERGYNQSAELATAIGRQWGLPVLDTLLERTRATRTQTRLTPGERHRNVAGAFRARAERASLRGLHLVLVDDVVTTGATLNACAAALHDGGARILSFVTFGRAPALGDRW